MPWKTSSLCVLSLLAVVISMTSTDARSRHLRHKSRNGGHIGDGGDDRQRGRHRLYDNNNNNDDDDADSQTHSGLPYRHQPHLKQHQHGGNNNNNNQSTSGYLSASRGFEPDHLGHLRGVRRSDREEDEEEEGGAGALRKRERRRRRGRKSGGVSVPSLHAMQTFGFRPGGARVTSSTTSSSSSSLENGVGDDVGSSRQQRRPIRGSRKAVVVTKKTYLKKEWCKTQPLKQVVRMRGCLRTRILNNFCYGQCNSFFIPKKARRDRGADAFLSCGFCRPRRFRWILVTMRCPGKSGMRYRRKRVQYIKKCRCMAQDVSMPPL